MLKKRIISLLTLNDGVLFRTKKFVPDLRYTVNFIDLVEIDEVVIIDVTPGGNRAATFKMIEDFTKDCFVPVMAGGGIKTVDEVRDFLLAGADKVVIERALATEPFLAHEIAERYGSQVLCMGVTHGLKVRQFFGATHLAESVAGEILFQSVERDGSLQGYDLERIGRAARNAKMPVIAGSGCGTWEHMRQAFEAGASAAATSNIHHFPPNAVRAAKKYLADAGVAVRPAA